MSSNNSSSPTDANAKENEMSGISMVTVTAYLRKLQRDTPPEELRKMLNDMTKEHQASPEERLRKKEARALLVAARKRLEAHLEERKAQREWDFEAGNQGPINISRPTMGSTEGQAERTEDRMPEIGFFTGFQLSQQLGQLEYVTSGAGDYSVPYEGNGYSESLLQGAALYADWILPWTDVREEE